VRELLGLQLVLSLGTADPIRPSLDHIDWAFTLHPDNVDPILQIHSISEVYKTTDPHHSGRPTVPAVVDISMKAVVQNDCHRLKYYLEQEWKPFHRPGSPDLFSRRFAG
jgi:putative glutathione S-transferase